AAWHVGSSTSHAGRLSVISDHRGGAGVTPRIFGIVNITEDSFSDGGRYLAPEAALAHARALRACGADVLDLGAASSNPDAKSVPADMEIRRLQPLVAALMHEGCQISIDSFAPETQAWGMAQRMSSINDLPG